MSDFFEFFIRFLPDLLKGAGMTLLLTAEGLAAGFVLGLAATLANVVKERTGATARCMPFHQEHIGDTCVVCGKKADKLVLWARAY